MTDQGLAGFVPWKYLWSQMNAPIVTVSYVAPSHWQQHNLKCLCVMDLQEFLSQAGDSEKREAVEEKGENVAFHPSCPLRGGENLTWLTWTHLASLANRKCPLQLFFGRGRGCSCLQCNGQMLLTMFAFDFWPENKNWHYKCPMISSKLAWHSIAGLGGFLFVLCKWLCSCCCIRRPAIRTHWPFSGEHGILKRQGFRLGREGRELKEETWCLCIRIPVLIKLAHTERQKWKIELLFEEWTPPPSSSLALHKWICLNLNWWSTSVYFDLGG